MPVSVSYSAKMLFEADFGSLDFSKVPADKLEAAKEYKRQKILSELLGDKGNPEDLRVFLENYGSNEKLGQFLFGEDFKLQENKISEEDILRKYDELNLKYRYEVSFEDYSKAVKACLYQAQVIEKNNNGDEVYTRAYKMLYVFGSMQKFDEFAKNFGDKYPSPVHDILQREFPVATGINLPSWRKLIMKSGLDAVEGFEHADKIPVAPENREALDRKLGELSYPRASENPEFAMLCKFYKVPENVFNKTVELIKNSTIKLKTNDNIPAVVVKAEEVDVSAKGVYLVKLPAGNMRGAILGKITDCCQSIGGESEQCVIDGLTRENNSFYVILKAKKTNFDPSNIDWANLEQNADIAGQGYVWRAQSGNAVMDSWEGLGDRYDWLMPKLLHAFAEKLHEADNSIDSLNIGHGGKTPDSLKITEASTEMMKEGFMYGDARIQSSIYVSDKLKKKREELARRTGIYDQACIFSTAIADKLLALTDEQLGKITIDKYEVLTLPHNVNWTVAHIDEVSKLNNQFFTQGAIIANYTVKIPIVDLKDFPESKIKLLMSRDARESYRTGCATVEDLKDLDESKIELLISHKAISAYEAGKVTAADLKDLPELQIWQKIAFAILSSKFPNQDLSSIESINEISKIQLLISYNVIEIYKTGKVTISDLKDLPESKIKLLVSDKAIEAYNRGCVTVADLKDLPEIKINLLVSNSAIAAYKTGKVTFADLKDFSEDSIKLLTSMDSCKKLKQGRNFAEIVNDNKSEFTSKTDKILAERILERQKGDLNR